MSELTIQLHIDGAWRDAATVIFRNLERGIAGATIVHYSDAYYFDMDTLLYPDNSVTDRRAVTVRRPVNLDFERRDRWPAWLLDLMPQGAARQRIAKEAGLRADNPAVEFQLLMKAGGSPIGNLRIREAWELEQAKITNIRCPPLDDGDIAARSERFLDVVNTFAHLASGSSGVQGEWPKALMTRSSRDGFWYPDPFVPTDHGAEHIIVKLLKSSNPNDMLILQSEAPYLELARALGLNVAAPLRYGNHVLAIPRFDRSVTDGRVVLHGQESLVSALGVAEFGHIARHEDYLQVIQQHSSDPAADTLDYVLRDLLNLETGNPDNHGRNTALRKAGSGGVRIAPLFDYAPMRLSDAGIGRVTHWRCMEGHDADTGLARICAAAACTGLGVDDLKAALTGKLPFFETIAERALDLGVHRQVVSEAFAEGRALNAIRGLEDNPCPN